MPATSLPEAYCHFIRIHKQCYLVMYHRGTAWDVGPFCPSAYTPVLHCVMERTAWNNVSILFEYSTFHIALLDECSWWLWQWRQQQRQRFAGIWESLKVKSQITKALNKMYGAKTLKRWGRVNVSSKSISPIGCDFLRNRDSSFLGLGVQQAFKNKHGAVVKDAGHRVACRAFYLMLSLSSNKT